MTMTPALNDQCIIWRDCPAVVNTDARNFAYEIVRRSARVGTDYIMSLDARYMLDGQPDAIRLRARLTTAILNAKLAGDDLPVVTSEMVARARSSPNLPMAERADRLLRMLVEETKSIGDSVFIPNSAVGSNSLSTNLRLAMAWSESIEPKEVKALARYLHEQGMVELGDTAFGFSIEVKVPGHAYIAALTRSTDSSQVFVAMWLNPLMDEIYGSAIEPAVRVAGYEPYRIDLRDDYDGKIDDQIVAQIRRSRFIIADFTHDDEGVRGSVYYEAGFAQGLNIPVIFTAESGSDLHFDTRQFPHILWNRGKLDAFRQRLVDRILAHPSLGEGPRKLH